MVAKPLCLFKISTIDCYGKKHKMLDIEILRDHDGVQSTLIQRSETSRTMFIAVVNDVGGYSYDK